jgi:Zn-dependent protease
MAYRENREPLGFLNYAFPVGSLSGVRIFLHWTFPVFFLIYTLAEGGRHGAEWGWKVALTFVGLFVIVLLHEFGHVFAGRREGIDAERVTLSPLGGLATLGEEMEGRSEVRIAAAGPAVNVVFLLLFLPVFALVGIRIGLDYLNPLDFWPTPTDDGNGTFLRELIYLVHKANLIVLLFNLIPAFPMDGGRILRGFLHGRMGRIRSTVAVTTVALFAAAAMLVWGVLESNLFLAFIAVSVGISAWLTRKRALMIAAEFGQFEAFNGFRTAGYSVEPDRRAERELEKKRKRREREKAKEREIERKVDDLLAKISEHGMGSLTRREKAFLNKASRRKQ